MCLSQRLIVLVFVWTKWQSLSLGTVEATEGGEKEGDFQIKAEECAVKNLRIRLGLALNVWLLGERKRGTEMERRTRGEREREKEQRRKEALSEVSQDRGQLSLTNGFVSHTKFIGDVFWTSSCVRVCLYSLECAFAC